MSLEILARNEKTRRLLAETQEQAQRLTHQTIELGAQQEELRATEAWFRGIVESAPDGMLVADETGTIILAGIPAALYERYIGAKDDSTEASLWIWLAGTGLLTLPAMGNFLEIGL